MLRQSVTQPLKLSVGLKMFQGKVVIDGEALGGIVINDAQAEFTGNWFDDGRFSNGLADGVIHVDAVQVIGD